MLTEEIKTKSKHWDGFAKNYEEAVYSLTNFPEKVARIIETIRKINREEIRILIVGCGSATNLQQAILENFPQSQITACDFSEAMLRISEENFSHPNLSHQFGDTTNLGFDGEFDVVISTNSIIPPTRKMVREMYASIHQSLKPGGKLIAYLPSFEAANDFAAINPQITLDAKAKSMWDTNAWQCFHTRELILTELAAAGFREISTQQIVAESRKEIAELQRLYGENAEKCFYLHFTEAKKSTPKIEFPPNDKTKEAESSLKIRSLTSAEITSTEIELVTSLYKEVFDNLGHYLINPRSGEFFSPAQIFEENREFTLEELLHPPHKIDLETGEDLFFYHDFQKLRGIIEDKLKENAFLTLLGEVGFTFANINSLRKIFTAEGWENPFHYSESANNDYKRDWFSFLEEINKIIKIHQKKLRLRDNFQLEANSSMLTINAIGILPQARGGKNGIKIAKELLKIIPREYKKTHLDIAEATPNSITAERNKPGIVFIPSFPIGENTLTLGRVANYKF